MPAYNWLFDSKLDTTHTEGKIITLRNLGVPYASGYERVAVRDLKDQASKIAASLASTGAKNVDPNLEIVAMIAYLQRLGTDIKKAPGADPTTAIK